MALVLPAALGETHGVTVAVRLAAAEPLADEVALPLRVAGLPLADAVAVPLRVAGLPLAAAVAVPLRAEALADAPADFVADALTVRLGDAQTPTLVVAVDCSLSSPQATANASRPTTMAIGTNSCPRWRFRFVRRRQ